MRDMPKVNVERVTMVTPAKPTSPHFMLLSELDLMWFPVKNIRKVIFFKTETPYSLLGDHIKGALSSVLVDFYPLAGRLSAGPHQSNKKPLIHCNDEGVEFIEAAMDCSFETLSVESNEHSAFFNLLAPQMAQLDTNASQSPLPLLSLQVTRFSSGGFCIGTSLRHVMGDGTSFWHFINSWAEISRGMPCISRKPLHDRTIYNPPPNNKKIVVHAVAAEADERKEAKIIKLTDEEEQNVEQVERPPQGSYTVARPPVEAQESVKASFVIGEDYAKHIKEEGEARSSFCAVLAHAWRSMTIARHVDDNEQVFLGFLANCRGRVEPPLPSSYFGNFLSYCGLKLSAKRLLSENLSFAVKLVEECVAVCATEEQLRLLVQLGSHNVHSCFMKELKGVYGTFAAGYHKFPMYECDFGWGKPVRVDVADIDPPGDTTSGLVVASPPPPNQHQAMQISKCLPVSQMQCFSDMLLNASREAEILGSGVSQKL